MPEPVTQNSAVPPVTAVKETKIKSTPRTPQIASLLKAGNKPEPISTNAGEATVNEIYTDAQLREVWNSFAEQRKKFQAEYQMLTQPFETEGSLIVVQLL